MLLLVLFEHKVASNRSNSYTSDRPEEMLARSHTAVAHISSNQIKELNKTCMSDYIHFSSDISQEEFVKNHNFPIFNPGNDSNPSKFSFRHLIEFVLFHSSQ